ncbi:hypothetical protein LSAT2_007818 [Lamellibrachia satsuma]|nr:hypothetical protein LSAT2_007818 [Lamellibrachia satsuma]
MLPETHIISDGWAAYHNIDQLNGGVYLHNVVAYELCRSHFTKTFLHRMWKMYGFVPIANCDANLIDHCRHRVCSSGTNQRCRKCNYDYGGDKTAYRLASRNGYSNRICEKICSWRSDSTFCYPGKCPGIGTQQGPSCQCAPGFGSTNCLTISAKPNITNCLVTAETTTSSSTEKVEIGCKKQSNTVIYTNFLPDKVKMRHTTQSHVVTASGVSSRGSDERSCERDGGSGRDMMAAANVT